VEEESIKEIGIHFGTEPKQGGNRQPELPLRLVLISDLTPNIQQPSDWSGPSKLQSVDKSSFARVMQQFSPRLFLEVPNHVSDSPKELELELSFPDLKAFRPEGIVVQVPAFAKLLQIRSLVSQVKDSQIELEEFKESLKEAGVDKDWAEQLYQALLAPPKTSPPPKPAESSPSEPVEGKLGSLLDMVDLGTGEPESTPLPPTSKPVVPGAMDALLQAVSGGASKLSAEKSIAEVIIDDLDQVLTNQINAILHHPRFQHLEAAWRGVKFLVDRIDFHKNIFLDVLAVRKEDLQEAFQHQVVAPELNRTTAITASAVILDFEFGCTPGELKSLDDLVEMSAGIQTPMVTSASASFFGLQTAAGLAELPVLWQYFQKPEYIEWNALRDKRVSNYLAMVVPRFLLRYAYGSNDPVKEFSFIESDEKMITHRLWGNGSLAVATTLCKSYVANGWPTHITGMHNGGKIENIYVWESGSVHIPLDVMLPESKLVEFSEAGFVVLGCRPDDDSAYVRFAPTVHRPETYDDADTTSEARIHSTLACQLLASSIAHHMLMLQGELTPGLSAAQLEVELRSSLQTILKTGGAEISPDSVTIEISDNPDRPDHYNVTVRLRPPAEILGQEICLVLGFEARR
jgi:type VI secretion system protein ImpC